jgi:outer membrane protein
MKKLCLLIPVVCLLSFEAVQAQMEKGKIMVGVASTLSLGVNGSDFMSLGFTTSKYKSSNYTSDPYKSTCFNFMPKVGYLVIDNLAVGLNLWVSTSSEVDTSDDDKYVENMFGIGPWARYYYPLEKFYPFLELNLGVGSSKYQYNSSSDEEKYSAMILGGGIGVAMPVGDRVTFDIMAGYTSVTSKEKDPSSEVDYKAIDGTIGLTMGFIVYFGPK